MDDIAAQMGISKRTLYELFDNKETLLLEALTCYYKKEQEYLKELADKSESVMDIVVEALRLRMQTIKTTAPAFFTDLSRYPRVLEYFEGESRKEMDSILPFFESGVKDGYFRPDLNFNIVAETERIMANAVINSSLMGEYPLDEIHHNTFSVFLRGICTAKGLEVINNIKF